MAPKPLENLEFRLNRVGRPVKCGKCGSHKTLVGFNLRFGPQFGLVERLNGVQLCNSTRPVVATLNSDHTYIKTVPTTVIRPGSRFLLATSSSPFPRNRQCAA